MTTPSAELLAAMLARLDDLENKEIGVDDLPLSALKRKLDLSGNSADPREILLPHSIVRDLLAPGVSPVSFFKSLAISGQETRTNVAYGLMPTADRIQAVPVPANALVAVFYWARWQNSVASNGRAAIFIGGNQLLVANNAAGLNTVEEAQGNATINVDVPLSSWDSGLTGASAAAAPPAPATTGQALSVGAFAGLSNPASPVVGLGGPCVIFNLAAGTYDFSVQFKSAAGNVLARDRRLYVLVLDPTQPS